MDIKYESESTGNAWPERPFLTILYQPRSTIRAIIDSNPKKYVLLLASLSGIARMLNFASRDSSSSINSGFEILSVIIIILVGGAVFGIISCYVGQYLSQFIRSLG